MPGRKTPLVTEHIYHVVNRGVASMPIFLNNSYYQRAIEAFLYYQNQNLSLRYSYFIRQTQNKRVEMLDLLRQQSDFLVEIIAYCLMPNHYHLLIKQLTDNGISTFMSKFANSYTRFFNTKNKRIGPIFQGKFKSVLIKNDNQLLHVSRYIHLNPFSSNIITNINSLNQYQYSSYPEYINPNIKSLCHKDIVLSYYKSKNSYQNFVRDHSDHQRNLQSIKKVMIDFEE
ncbi:MAG: transposase [Candidatus Beckwithbacteria bacterium]|nr:transposase [Patescibacteria group bacterium]